MTALSGLKSAIIQVEKWHYSGYDGRGKREEGRCKREEGRGKMEEGMSDEQMALWYNGEMI